MNNSTIVNIFLRKIFKFILSFILLTALAGCSRYRVVDQIKMVDIMGFEQGNNSADSKLYGGVIIHEYSMGKEEDVLTSIMSYGKSATQTLSQINQKSPNLLEIGKTQVIVLGADFAKEQGIYEVVHSICRNAKIGANLKIVISEEPLSVFFKKLTELDGNFLPHLLEQNMIHNILPESNMQTFLYNFYGIGRDAYIPYSTITREGDIVVKKLGVIDQNSKLKLLLEEEEATLIKLIQDQSKEIFFPVPIERDGKEGSITLKSLRGKSNLKSNHHDIVLLRLKLDTIILDYPEWIKLPDDYAFLEKEIKNFFKKRYQELFKKFQDNHVDPLGIGDIYRSKNKNWNEKDFYNKRYPNLKLESTIKIDILQSGVGEDTYE